MATYKAVMRPVLEYASSIWSLLASLASINKLQGMQTAALRTATGFTQDTNCIVDYDSKWSTKFHKDCMFEIFVISLLRRLMIIVLMFKKY